MRTCHSDFETEAEVESDGRVKEGRRTKPGSLGRFMLGEWTGPPFERASPTS